jgi:hypothetical protein
MPRKAPAKKNQPTASKKKASNVNPSSKNPPPKLKRSAAASKTKSSGNSIDALVKKQIASLRQADTLFKDAISIVEIYLCIGLASGFVDFKRPGSNRRLSPEQAA